MKKILLIIIALFIGLFGLNEIKAETTCLYETDYGVYKVELSQENTFYNVAAISYINKQRKEIKYNKKYNASGFSAGCPEFISMIYDDDNDVLHVISLGFYFSEKVVEKFDIDGQEFNNLSCKYGVAGNTSPYLYVSVANATKIQPIKFQKKVMDFNHDSENIIQISKEEFQTNAVAEFGAGECPSKINPMVYGWNANSVIMDGAIYDNTVLSGTKNYIKSGISSKLMKGVFCGSGEGKITDIPAKIPELTSMMFTIVQVAVPIILVIMGSLDLFKGITSGKEDEMKKGRQMFIKRLVVGAIIFLVVIIVKLIISVVADTGVDNMIDCIDCFISNDCGGM